MHRLVPIALALILSSFNALALEGTDEGTEAYKQGRYDESIRIWTEQAQAGDERAKFLLSTLYYDGKGVPQDIEEASRLLRSAAEDGFAPAQFNLGNNYYNGLEGLPIDQQEAAQWWNRSALQGFIPAQYNLGVVYLTGNGADKDIEQAVKWFEKAAENGSKPAQDILNKIKQASSAPSPAGQAAAQSPAPSTGNADVAGFPWIRSQADRNYTLQLLSTLDSAKASAFAQKVVEEGQADTVALYSFDRDGTPWHAVLFGSYPDRQTAEQVQAGLPLKKWQTGSWPRRFQDIKRIMLP